MLLRGRVSGVVMVATLFAGGLAVHGQDRLTARLEAIRAAPPTYFLVDDMLLDTAAYELRSLAGGTQRIRPRGAPFPSSNVDWFHLKFDGWDFGVLPVQFAPDITDAQRDLFMNACAKWGVVAPVLCVPHTSQRGYFHVSTTAPEVGACNASLGQFRRLVAYGTYMPAGCWDDASLAHELGHVFGLFHEHQRPDRDRYLEVDYSNVERGAESAFDIEDLLSDTGRDALGQYDFLSIMHYWAKAFAVDPAKPVLIPKPGYASYAATMGLGTTASDLDHESLAHLYGSIMRPLYRSTPYYPPTTRFEPDEFLDAMERLQAFHYSRLGLRRAEGLVVNGRPDFLGISTWVGDVYLSARSSGFTDEQSFGIVVAAITQTEEWRGQHPGRAPLPAVNFTPYRRFDRNEFLDALQRLDAFFASADGLQRPGGLSIAGAPDFGSISTWIFEVYLNERLSGGSSTVAWSRVINGIQDTDEWRSKQGR